MSLSALSVATGRSGALAGLAADYAWWTTSPTMMCFVLLRAASPWSRRSPDRCAHRCGSAHGRSGPVLPHCQLVDVKFVPLLAPHLRGVVRVLPDGVGNAVSAKWKFLKEFQSEALCMPYLSASRTCSWFGSLVMAHETRHRESLQDRPVGIW